MKYDKNAILNTAKNLQSKASDLGSTQNKLGRVSPEKCNPNFYSKRYSLMKRLNCVWSELISLGIDMSNAANKMDSDDIQNANRIRQIFNNRTSFIRFGHSAFTAGNAVLKRNWVLGNILSYSKMAINRRTVSELGNAIKGQLLWYTQKGTPFERGAASLGLMAGKVEHAVWSNALNDTFKFSSTVTKWGAQSYPNIRDGILATNDYVWKSLSKFVLGDYSDDNTTLLSFGGNIVAGIFGVDLPLDVRDIVYDIQHWGEGDYFGVKISLDVISVIPVIGVIKNVKYVDDLADGAKNLGKVAETTPKAGNTVNAISGAGTKTTDFGKATEAQDAGKTVNVIPDADSKTTDLEKAAEEPRDAGNVTIIPPKKPLSEFPENVQSAYKKYEDVNWNGPFEDATPGTKAGKIYKNRDGTLPKLDQNGNAITYKEYDVNNLPVGATTRDEHRFVRGSDGSVYYTSDHYKTFTKLE